MPGPVSVLDLSETPLHVTARQVTLRQPKAHPHFFRHDGVGLLLPLMCAMARIALVSPGKWPQGATHAWVQANPHCFFRWDGGAMERF